MDQLASDVIAALEVELTKSEEQVGLYTAHYDKLKDKYRALRQRNAETAEELAESRHVYKFQKAFLLKIINRYLEPFADKNDIQVTDDWTVDSMFTVLGHIFQDAMEAGSLQDQVKLLQKELFSKADKVQAVADQQFAQDFRVIVSLVKTLSRTTCLIDLVDPIAALDKGQLLEGVSHHHWDSRARKRYLIEAWVWSVLVKMVFRTPFAILGAKCDSLSEVWQNLFLQGHLHDWPCPSGLCETWRYTTMEQMMDLLDCDVITKGVLKQSNRSVEPSVFEARQAVMNNIETGLGKISASPDLVRVQNIIDKAFALALLMSLQRYRLQVTWPKVGDIFVEGQMSAVPNPDDSDNLEGVVAFIVNPGLTKWGDTHGKHFDQRYDIVHSLVQLEVATPKQEIEEVLEIQYALDGISTSER
ncbi:hypothetical protein CC86DRAFT_343307 [Ophiobolus disseminans]|uniref:Uncharacterized protein n=1 Tax=Ophiobolus disseminans TaxID=1469910 RepID=A0A6A7ACR6_9PLEO|nr:hypothetical protein CC86DRAFT_343307 [Ophiobolus disseminans]